MLFFNKLLKKLIRLTRAFLIVYVDINFNWFAFEVEFFQGKASAGVHKLSYKQEVSFRPHKVVVRAGTWPRYQNPKLF